jgi:hypothetical protein
MHCKLTDRGWRCIEVYVSIRHDNDSFQSVRSCCEASVHAVIVVDGAKRKQAWIPQSSLIHYVRYDTAMSSPRKSGWQMRPSSWFSSATHIHLCDRGTARKRDNVNFFHVLRAYADMKPKPFGSITNSVAWMFMMAPMHTRNMFVGTFTSREHFFCPASVRALVPVLKQAGINGGYWSRFVLRGGSTL